jgi:hypothetical protein
MDRLFDSLEQWTEEREEDPHGDPAKGQDLVRLGYAKVPADPVQEKDLTGD